VLNREGANLFESHYANFTDKLKIIINYHPEWERFYSVKLGLTALGSINPVFIHNVDNPFINQCVLNSLLDDVLEFDYAVPTYRSKGGHPVLLSEKVIKNIITEEENSLNLKEYLSAYKKKTVNADDEKVLINVNSKVDYNTLF